MDSKLLLWRPSELVMVHDNVDSVQLFWLSPPEMMSISGFRVRVSVNDGVTWRTGIEDTETAETCVTIINIQPEVHYCFKVRATAPGPYAMPCLRSCLFKVAECGTRVRCCYNIPASRGMLATAQPRDFKCT
jgi:hypothetical protein